MKLPQVSIRKLTNAVRDRDGLVVFVFAGELGKLMPDVQRAVGKPLLKELAQFAQARGFKAAEGSTLYVPAGAKQLTLVVGLGQRQKFTIDVLRRVAATALKTLERLRVKKVVLVAPRVPRATPAEIVGALTEGLLLGGYEFDKYLSSAKEKFSTEEIEIAIGRTGTAVDKAKKLAERISSTVNWVRDLENDNSDAVNPERIEVLAREVAKSHKLRLTSFSGSELRKMGLRLIHAVGRASQWEPRLVMLEYRGASKKSPVHALVGKGVTFDTGGVNLKPSMGGGLNEMHMDMSGAATVMAVLKLASELKLKINLVAAMPIVENALGGNSYKPGSIIRAYNGKSVEIDNTDAEGRLILADAIAYTVEQYKPASLVTVATLTGAVLVSLGHHMAGLVTSNNRLASQLTAASHTTGELVWRLPLDDYFRGLTRSRRADFGNVGRAPRLGDTSKGGALLEAFADKTPFAHLDIAGTATLPSRSGYQPAGGTGYGVRLLLEYVRHAR